MKKMNKGAAVVGALALALAALLHMIIRSVKISK